MEIPPIHRPIPRRTFELTPSSTPSSIPSTPLHDHTPDIGPERRNGMLTPQTTRSFLNLTSSTLLGIYASAPHDNARDESATPWGTGSQTPIRRRSIDGGKPDENVLSWKGQSMKPKLKNRPRRTGFRGRYLPLALQTILLFVSGVGFGSLITHLHRTQHITPVPIPSVGRNSWYYQLSWGIFGILLGNGLLLLDLNWDDQSKAEDNSIEVGSRNSQKKQYAGRESDNKGRSPTESSVSPIWYSAVRSIGAFVGIAFAMRNIPWQSTLQVGLTLALVNPVLWYLIDRSYTGFIFSTAISVAGTFVLLIVDPNFVPVPAIYHAAASERIGVVTWLASILFCTSLCFGAIGRKLQL